MKKYIKIFLFTIFIFLIGILNVSAEEKAVITNVELDSKSSNVIINEEVSLDGSTIKSNVNFYDVGDYVKYKITIENNDEEDYVIDKVIDDNDNSELEFSYIYDNEIIKSKETKNIILIVTYTSELPIDSSLTPTNSYVNEINTNITIKLTEPSFDILNPATYDKATLFLLLEIIFVVVLFIIFIKLKVNKKGLLTLLVFSVFLIPNITKASKSLDIKFIINNKMEIKINFLDRVWKDKITDSFTKVKFVKQGEYPSNAIDVSQEQDESIMAWIEDDTVYIGSRYKIFFPIDSNGLFRELNVTNYDFNNRIDTTFVTNMAGMFYFNKELLEIDVSTFKTGNVTKMTGMFNTCEKVKSYDLSNWDVSKVENTNSMFSTNSALESIDLSSFETPSLKTATGMFYLCTSLKELDLSKFNTSNVESIYMMIAGSTSLETLNLDNWDFSGEFETEAFLYGLDSLKTLSARNWKLPQDFSFKFYNDFFYGESPLKSLDVSNWDVSNTNNFYALFAYLEELEELKGLNTWEFNEQVNLAYTFYYCSKLKELDLSSFDFSHVGNITGMLGKMKNLRKIITPKKILDDKVIELPNIFLDENNNSYNAITKDMDGNLVLTIEEINILDDGDTVNKKIKKLAYSGNTWGGDDYDITRIVRSTTAPDLSTMTEDNIISLDYSTYPVYAWFDNGTIYYYCEGEEIRLNYDSSKMFSGILRLTEVRLTGVDSSWTGNMSEMFNKAGQNATSLVIDVSDMETNLANNMSSMFAFAGQNASSLEIIGLSNFDTSNVENMNRMFTYAGQQATSWTIGDISGWNVGNVKDFSSMFDGAAYNTAIVNLDLSEWDVGNANNMRTMFYAFGYTATSWSVGDISNWNVEKVTDMSYMFYNVGGNLTTLKLDLSGWNTKALTSAARMFYIYRPTVELDLSNFDLSHLTNEDDILTYITKLTKITTPKVQPASGKSIALPGEYIDSENNTYTVLDHDTPSSIVLTKK